MGRTTKGIDFLKSHESGMGSRFVENAKWRQENRVWLGWSREVALRLIDYMQEKGMNRSEFAEHLGVTPQYVSRLLSGRINFSFKSVAELEDKLGISLLQVVTH